jgi:hypothetical protein
MHQELLANTASLSDVELLSRVVSLASRERHATVELVGHLAEFDARKLDLGEGYSSLFAYCTGALRLPEHGAYNRIEAARLSRRFPVILDLLADGSLNLSTIRLLAPHLRPDNFDSVVEEAQRRTKRDVEALVARLAPRPDVPSTVRKLPAPALSERGTGTGTSLAAPPEPRAAIPPLAAPSAAPIETSARPGPRPVISALAPERYRVQFTVGAATHEKLRRVQDLLRREIPDGDPGAIFDRALTLLLEDVARKKLAAISKPRPAAPTRPGSRHIPADVTRAVWLRDGGQCAFLAQSGRRCQERVFLEFHHEEPYAMGGEPTIANISLRCRPHNVYESELVFGPAPGKRTRTDAAPPGMELALGRVGEAEGSPEVARSG